YDGLLPRPSRLHDNGKQQYVSISGFQTLEVKSLGTKITVCSLSVSNIDDDRRKRRRMRCHPRSQDVLSERQGATHSGVTIGNGVEPYRVKCLPHLRSLTIFRGIFSSFKTERVRSYLTDWHD